MDLYRGFLSRARIYRNASAHIPSDILRYTQRELEWGSMAEYAVVRKVGRGRYGEVFEGRHVASGSRCTIKVLKPLKVPVRFQREISVLQTLHGGPCIPRLLDFVRCPSTSTPALVFDWAENESWRTLVPKLTDLDLRYYMFQLCRALNFAHSRGVMHRDVKPTNYLVDHPTRAFRLIDWGLAEFYVPRTDYNVRVSTRSFKAPELLLNMKHYDYSMDMWSTGVTIASIMFRRMPFFGKVRDSEVDVDDMLVHHAQVLGTHALDAYLRKYGLELNDVQAAKIKPSRRVRWHSFVNAKNRHLVSDEGLDLLDGLLWCVCGFAHAPRTSPAVSAIAVVTAHRSPPLPRSYDHMKRLTALEAMAHPYFDPVRQLVAEAEARQAAAAAPSS